MFNTVYDIVLKINNLKQGTTTSIANLIDYKPEISFVEPIIQGKVGICIDHVCKRMNINLEVKKNEIGGLAYFNEFTKC